MNRHSCWCFEARRGGGRWLRSDALIGQREGKQTRVSWLCCLERMRRTDGSRERRGRGLKAVNEMWSSWDATNAHLCWNKQAILSHRAFQWQRTRPQRSPPSHTPQIRQQYRQSALDWTGPADAARSWAFVNASLAFRKSPGFIPESSNTDRNQHLVTI